MTDDEPTDEGTEHSEQIGTMPVDAFLEAVDEADEELAWFFREFRKEKSNGRPLEDIADELSYRILDAPADIEYLITLAITFGVVWEKHDQRGPDE